MKESSFIIREATQSDEFLIAEHLCHIALELGVSTESIRQDWLDQTVKFIDRARHELQYKGFIAEINDQVIGSASCQLLELYPRVSREYQKGYIWGVYVVPSFRRKGVATKLMKKAMAHLKAIGCTKAVLHASHEGKLLYSNLGYTESNEMVFSLI
ncbi:GNAT family N-acetyltransferase [Pseudanabaena sp. FACHB-2040]|uniref:GNAT family N-acetyltransferase n=1 Tax=Pseudanabaena sp. FACHB-2040 TaxID=2692859 RepID=UPI0018EF6CF7